MTRLARRQTEWRQTIASSAIEVTGAALFEFVPTAAWATVVASGLDRHRRVDEVPVCAVLYKRGLFAVAVFPLAVVPACGEGDKGVFRLATEHFAAFYLQSQPGTFGAPPADGLDRKSVVSGKRESVSGDLGGRR